MIDRAPFVYFPELPDHTELPRKGPNPFLLFISGTVSIMLHLDPGLDVDCSPTIDMFDVGASLL